MLASTLGTGDAVMTKINTELKKQGLKEATGVSAPAKAALSNGTPRALSIARRPSMHSATSPLAAFKRDSRVSAAMASLRRSPPDIPRTALPPVSPPTRVSAHAALDRASKPWRVNVLLYVAEIPRDWCNPRAGDAVVVTGGGAAGR